MPLTDSQVRNAKPQPKPYKLTDGGGLVLEVRPSGAKLWRYRYRIADKQNVFAMGEYVQAPRGETKEQAQARCDAGMLTLAEARAKREEARALVKQGIHPSHQRQAQKAEQVARNANTFEAVAREWLTKKKPRCTPGTLQQIEQQLKADVFPYIGNLPIRNVTAPHVRGILLRIEGRGSPTVAVMARQHVSAIFRYAGQLGLVDADPAALMKGLITPPKTKHHRALTREELRQLVHELDGYGGRQIDAIALRLMMLTFVRTKELCGARWEEFDLNQKQWRIPAERMEMREPHFVPLSRQAVALLRELATHTGGHEHLFPGCRNPRAPMSRNRLNKTVLKELGFNGKGTIGFSGHGFRGTASTLLNEMGFRLDVIERQLAHAERNQVRASYNQAEYMEERRAMMQHWADLVDEIAKGESNVLLFKRPAA